MKKAIMTSALIVGATLGLATATFAQSGQVDRPGNSHGVRAHVLNHGTAAPDTERGGPGPRIQGGSGAGAGAER